MAKTTKKVGSRLRRTEAITVRLDAKLRFIVELAARSERRTVSSYVENVIESAVSSPAIAHPTRPDQKVSWIGAMEFVWDPLESDRIVRLAVMYPYLLNIDEELIWKLLITTPEFWTTPDLIAEGVVSELYIADIKWPLVRELWELIKQVAFEEEKRSTLRIAIEEWNNEGYATM